MTEIWLKQCPICLVDFVPLKDFRFFACGHKWCSSCSKKHKSDPLCGECRQPKGKPHRIYLDLEDLVDDQVVLVSDGLNAINMDSSPSDIEAFNCTVRKLRQKPNTDPEISRVLLEAVKDLKERVAPLVERCSELRNSNEALTRQVQDLQSQIKISKEVLKKAKVNTQTERDEVKRLHLAVARQRAATEVVMTDKKQLEAKVEQQDKEIKLLNTKLKALSKKPKPKSTHNVEDPDSSFQVESKTELETTRRRLKRRVAATRQINTSSSDLELDSPRLLKRFRP